MYEEEIDVTEVYFIIKGEYAIGFNSYYRWSDGSLDKDFPSEDEEMKGPEDVFKQGYLIA